MTRIDFHTQIADKLAYVCRLVRKARQQGHQLVIYLTDESAIGELDRQLWTFSPSDFLPHCLATDPLATKTPVLLTHEAVTTPHHDVLINLDRERPEFFSRFDRLIEIVGIEEDDLQAGRQRWRFYRDRGYALNRIDVSGAKA